MAGILAIDPGPEMSAYCIYDGPGLVLTEKVKNEWLVDEFLPPHGVAVCAIEMIASYGMPVGKEIFETCVWIGRFAREIERAGKPVSFVYRKDVKLHLCGTPRAKDANVRQALIDKFGGKEKAIGKKKTKGPLYGVHGDEWAALAVAVTYDAGRLHLEGYF